MKDGRPRRSEGSGGQTGEADMAIVVIDPGHGGTAEIGGSSANNATGPTGLKEKTVTLDLAKRVQPMLEADGHGVKLTRTGDTNLGLAARAGVAKAAGADAFVAIHMNASDAHNAQGTETYHHSSASPDSKALAAAVQKRVQAATGLKDRGVKQAGFGAIKPASHAPKTAACLVEVSFLDRADEEARLKTDAYKDKVAKAIAEGITDWLKADGRM